MNRHWTTAVVIGVSLWLVNAAGQGTVPASPYKSGEILVQFRGDASPGQQAAVMTAQSARRIRRFEALKMERLQLRSGQSVAAALAAFAANPLVASVQPNYERRTTETAPPNDPHWLDDSLWGLRKIQAHTAWSDYTTGDDTVVIANIDTGVNYNHPDLSANMWRNTGEVPGNGVDDDGNGYVDDVFGIDTVNNDGDPMDDHGHGTHTAGTAAASGNNGIGVVGVSWRSKILACKFIGVNGTGFDSDAIECFNYVLAMKARGVNVRVTSNSWGSARQGFGIPTSMLNAINAMGTAGIVSVFAAGNSGVNNDVTPHDPASIPAASIIAVASSNGADVKSGFSNYGATSTDLAAPGEGIASTYFNGYAGLSGTSMAAPHVAGAAALIVGAVPGVTLTTLKNALLTSVDVLPSWSGLVVSGGRLNVWRALMAAGANAKPTVSITNPADGALLTAPTATTIAATASDPDGTVANVEFFVNGASIGADTTFPYSVDWVGAPAGAYTLRAVATDDDAATREATVSVTVMPAVAGRVNVALASNGGTATASSTHASNFGPASTINGDRKGLNWGNGGGWNDGTGGTFPDWLEVTFNGPKTIDEISVFTLQDDYGNPVEPTVTLAFTQYGLRAFDVQYWTGSAWQTVPGGVVSNNGLVWRKVVFAPVTTARIRVLVSDALSGSSRITEVEALTNDAGAPTNVAPTVALTGPTSGTYIAPALLDLAASAADSDGTVTSVAFYANGTLLATDPTGPYATTWIAPAGTYTLTAIATDDDGATTVSAPVAVTVNPPTGPARVNVALASNGAVATASSTHASNFAPASTINGDRKGVGWGNGGGWNDATGDAYPDWLEVSFNGAKTIDEISVFTLQDSYSSPVDPTASLTFSQYGVRAFDVQYWTGSAWQTVPGGAISNNNLVWRKLVFSAVTTTGIRVLISSALSGHSRLTEVEAFTSDAGAPTNVAPTVTLTGPPSGTYTAPATLDLAADAADSDGTVTSVAFYANGTWLATDSTSPYSTTWVAPAGTYALTAIATDDDGATTVSASVAVTVDAPTGPARVNVALASNGAVASASSTHGSNFAPASTINGDRKGVGWGNGGGWNDATGDTYPDWLEVTFNGPKTIDEISVFTLQDDYGGPVEPTTNLMFSQFGLKDFEIQYWTGTDWQTVAGGAITGNSLVWRQASFAPVTTTRIRVLVSHALSGHSRITEVEAYTTGTGSSAADATSMSQGAAPSSRDVGRTQRP